MASLLRCSCPHCGGAVGLKDQALVGKRIRCPKCQQPFLVELPDEEEPIELPLRTSVKAASKPVAPPPRVDRDNRVQAGLPPKKKKPIEEDEDDDRPRKKKKKKTQQGVLVPWLLIGGGATLLLTAVIILVVVLGNKGSDRPEPGGDGPGPIAKNGGAGGNKQQAIPPAKKQGEAADQLVDVGGVWPEPNFGFKGVEVGAATTLTLRIVIVGGSWKKYGNAIKGIQDGIHQRIMTLAGPGVGQVGASDEDPNGENRRMTMHLGPYKEDTQAFAKKIDFGTVRSVEGRTIILVVRKDKAPAPLAKDTGDGGAKKQGDPAELAVDLGGIWPDPTTKVKAVETQPPEGSLNVRVLIAGISRKNHGKTANDCVLSTVAHVVKLVGDPKVSYITQSDDEPNGMNHRLTINLHPVTLDPQAFANKIDFGTVRRVQGRVITVVVRKGRVPGVNLDKQVADGGKKQGEPADETVNLDGPWPPVFTVGIKATPNTVLWIRVVIAGDSWTKSGQAIQKTEKAILDKIRAIAGPPQLVKFNSNSGDEAGGENRRMIMVLGPVNQEAQAFAKRIDFGTVRSVEGRVITLVVRKGKEPGANPAP